MSNFLWHHGQQHARILYPSLSPRSLLKLMSLESVMPSNHVIFYISHLHSLCRIDLNLIFYVYLKTLLIQISSVAQLCSTLCDPMDCSTPGFPIHHHLPELAQTHVHRVHDAIQPSHPLLSPSSAFNLTQHQDLFQWVSSLHQVAKGLELQLQHQSFQWIFRTDFL